MSKINVISHSACALIVGVLGAILGFTLSALNFYLMSGSIHNALFQIIIMISILLIPPLAFITGLTLSVIAILTGKKKFGSIALLFTHIVLLVASISYTLYQFSL